MNKTNKGHFNGIVYLVVILIIIRHIMRMCTNLITLSFGFDSVVVYNICLSIVMITLLIFILRKNKYALYGFFALQFINAIIISFISGDWLVHLSIAAVISGVAAAFLFIKEEGVTAWQTILSNGDPEERAEEVFHNDSQGQNMTQGAKCINTKTPSYGLLRNPLAYRILLVIGFLLVGFLFYRVLPVFESKKKTEVPSGKSEKIDSVFFRYVYIDMKNVLHTKNGCKSVYKDHNMQRVNPVDPVCLSYESLSRVCSQCVSEQAIDSLHNLFDIYRQSYNNVGELHDVLIEKYDDIPDILRFRENLRDRRLAKRLYDVMVANDDCSGSFEDFLAYIGLDMPTD